MRILNIAGWVVGVISAASGERAPSQILAESSSAGAHAPSAARVFSARELREAVTVDGVLSEATWKQAEWVTEGRVSWAAAWKGADLFLAWKVRPPQGDVRRRDRDAQEIFEDAHVEIWVREPSERPADGKANLDALAARRHLEGQLGEEEVTALQGDRPGRFGDPPGSDLLILALNAAGSLLDRRGEDRTWNALLEAQAAGDRQEGTGELRWNVKDLPRVLKSKALRLWMGASSAPAATRWPILVRLPAEGPPPRASRERLEEVARYELAGQGGLIPDVLLALIESRTVEEFQRQVLARCPSFAPEVVMGWTLPSIVHLRPLPLGSSGQGVFVQFREEAMPHPALGEWSDVAYREQVERVLEAFSEHALGLAMKRARASHAAAQTPVAEKDKRPQWEEWRDKPVTDALVAKALKCTQHWIDTEGPPKNKMFTSDAIRRQVLGMRQRQQLLVQSRTLKDFFEGVRAPGVFDQAVDQFHKIGNRVIDEFALRQRGNQTELNDGTWNQMEARLTEEDYQEWRRYYIRLHAYAYAANRWDPDFPSPWKQTYDAYLAGAHSWLGLHAVKDPGGLKVVRVEPYRPAWAAGFRGGEVLTHWDTKALDTPEELAQQVEGSAAMTRHELKGTLQGVAKTWTVVLATD